jgi:hypothetical protein
LKYFQSRTHGKRGEQSPPGPNVGLRAPNGERKRQTGVGSGVQKQVRNRQKNLGQIFARLERKKRNHGRPEGGRGIS